MNAYIEEMYLYAKKLIQEELHAKELPIAPDLAYIKGEYKGMKVEMKSHAWQTELYRLIRYTGLESEGKLSTFNLVLYPHHHFDAPIFASDWVANQQQLRIAVMDAMPLFPEEADYLKKWVQPFQDLHQKSLKLAPVFDRKLSWSSKYLGACACLATGVPANDLKELMGLWKSYLNLYLYLTANLKIVPPQRKAAVEDWHRRYNKEHREVENSRNPYMRYFGEEIGRRYNEEFLFAN